MTFVHLHRHSEYSVLDGMGSADDYAKRAVDLGQFALAQTDHGNICGALEHIAACEKHGLHPIVGMEAYFRLDRANHDAKQKNAKSPYHMILFADGYKGYQSLMRLSSKAYVDGFYYKPCVDYDLLEEFKEGIICSTSCINSYLSQCILEENDTGAYEHIEKLQRIYKDKLYVEIMPHDFDDQRLTNKILVSVANRYSVPVIATVDAHFVNQEEHDTAAVLFHMNMKETASEVQAKKDAGAKVYGECPTLYLMEEHEVRELFQKNHPGLNFEPAIANTALLASQVSPFALNKGLKLPRVKDQKKTADQILREWCFEGLDRIGEGSNPIYRDRMEYELSVLKDKGVLDYFVIVGEIVRWARDEGIRVCPGRGSAAGCLVSYLIRITAIDPIPYGLLFERFLNPDRKGMPDIDIDFPTEHVDRVREKLAEIHGRDHVSNVISHQTFKAKGVIRDVSRYYEIPIEEVNRTTKRIDDGMDLDEALEIGEVQLFFQRYPHLLTHCKRLDGTIKATSQHASAVVVTDKPVTEYMPTMTARSGSPTVTAFSDKPSSPIISEYGILKIDFLSSTELDIQMMACELIEKRRGLKLDLDDLPMMRDPNAVDANAMKIFCDGHTFGLFQFGGSAGITGMLKKMQPQSINDLAACNALYRPGPLDGGVADDYLSKIGHPELVTYWHPAVKPFLERSNGIMIYQEQLMQVCQAIGGFSPGQADDMRKATGKLYRLGKEEAKEFMGQFKGQWDKGTQQSGIPKLAADSIWEKILAFGGYSFNASHSVSYSAEAYQGSYLKANYPDEYYTAIMAKDRPKAAQAVREAIARGIVILPPSLNHSEAEMSLDDQGIRCGLRPILDVGEIAVQEILEMRPFIDVQDFLGKVNKRRCNSKVVSGLFKSGALDEFGMEDSWTYLESVGIDRAKLQRERLGFIAGQSMSTEISEVLNKVIDPDVIEISNPGDYVIVGGEIIEIKEKIDRKGNLMCWFTVAYGADSWRITVFASMYPGYKSMIQEGDIVLARTKIDDRGGMLLQFLTTPEGYIDMKEKDGI